MSEVITYKCDICGAVKGEVNHWFRASFETPYWFELRRWDCDKPGEEIHLCGMECAQRAMTKAMQESSGSRTYGKLDLGQRHPAGTLQPSVKTVLTEAGRKILRDAQSAAYAVPGYRYDRYGAMRMMSAVELVRHIVWAFRSHQENFDENMCAAQVQAVIDNECSLARHNPDDMQEASRSSTDGKLDPF